MSWIFNTGSEDTVNFASNTSQWAWLFKELLKSLGWEIQASSDGTNVSNTPGNGNDQIGSAGEMNTNNAWYVIKQPTTGFTHWGRAGGRQFIVRRGTGVTSWLIVYVPLDDNEAAQTPTANGTTTTIPTFTKSVALLGTLPDTTTAFVSNASTLRYMIGAMDSAPWGFFMTGWNTSGGDESGLIFDPLMPDSVNPLDEDPYIVCATSANGIFSRGVMTDGTGSFKGYYRKGRSDEQFVTIPANCYACDSGAGQLNYVIPNALGRDPYDKYDRTLPGWYIRPVNRGNTDQLYGIIKGESSIWRWTAGAYVNGTRRTEGVLNDRVVAGDVTVPWPPAKTPHWGI